LAQARGDVKVHFCCRLLKQAFPKFAVCYQINSLPLSTLEESFWAKMSCKVVRKKNGREN